MTCTIRGTLSTTELSDAISDDDFTSDFTLYLVVLVDGKQYEYIVGAPPPTSAPLLANCPMVKW